MLYSMGDEPDYFPMEGIERIWSFLEDSGFCNKELDTMNGMFVMMGFEPRDVMDWEKYLDRKLTRSERLGIIDISGIYASAFNGYNRREVECPYRAYLQLEREFNGN